MEEFEKPAIDDSGEEEDWQALVNLVVFQLQQLMEQSFYGLDVLTSGDRKAASRDLIQF